MLSVLCLLLVTLTLINNGQAQQTMVGLPLSRVDYAFWVGQASMVTVEMTIDLSCSATKDAWETIQKVIETYDEEVQFKIRILPLPYHHTSYMLSKGASVVYFYEGDSAALKYMNAIIEKQDDFLNTATDNMSYNDILNDLEKVATNDTGLTLEQFYEGMDPATQAGATIEQFTRYEFKYLMLGGFYGTPQYKIQGLITEGLSTFQEWEETLNPLVKTTKRISQDTNKIYL